MPQPSRTTTLSALPRPFHMLLFFGGGLWIVAAQGLATRAATGLTVRFNLSSFYDLFKQSFFLFLLLIGFATVRWIATRSSVPDAYSRGNGLRNVNALPSRPTTREEFLRGLAIGWGMVIAAVLPMMFFGALHPEFSFSFSNFGYALLSILVAAIATLALEVAFRGFIFAEFIAATGPTFATLFLSLLYATLASFSPNATLLSILDAFLFGVLFSIAYLRTRALWVGWGIHFAWAAFASILFGLPIAGDAGYTNLIFTSVSGPQWLTGGPYGPEAAFFTAIVLLIAILVLLRATRHYAWEYAYTAPTPAGYPMEVAPPPAHTAMETASATTPQPLIQILNTTPTAPSTNPEIEDHLNRNS
ncbi:MAG: CPBP family intramembrane glutamic endopeptidase [Acidobacteriaceae bacterium]